MVGLTVGVTMVAKCGLANLSFPEMLEYSNSIIRYTIYRFQFKVQISTIIVFIYINIISSLFYPYHVILCSLEVFLLHCYINCLIEVENYVHFFVNPCQEQLVRITLNSIIKLEYIQNFIFN